MAEYSKYTESTDSTYNTESTESTSYKIDRHKRICFAILVHSQRYVVINLLDNIRCYCPDSSGVLFNGGNDSELCEGLGYPVCPTSRKLSYGVTSIFTLEVMRWLEDINKSYDYLGVETKIPDDDFYCLIQLRQEPYYESFNVGQVYSKRLVKYLLTSDKYDLFHKTLQETQAFGVDELVFVTIADRLGIEVHPYQKEVSYIIRYRTGI
ncbi:hypothetical protein ACP8HI_05200 [Paenibacillus sp. FA6]|uniref:hypothetical protein n=1 Tax=Paenibacillus sp. FA6 TaxID=3413029 RepID=UPI003F65B7C6